MAFSVLPHQHHFLHSKSMQYPSSSPIATHPATLLSQFSKKHTPPIIHNLYSIESSLTLSGSKADLKFRRCYAVHTDSLPLAKNKEKRRVERFSEKIGAIPALQRPKFVENLIEKHGELKNVAYFNDLLGGLLIVKELNFALKLFDEMPLHGVSPDWWTYSILIRHYCTESDPDEGRKLMDSMIQNGFRPNVATFTILINSFCSKGKIQRAIDVLELMGTYGCRPNIRTYNCVLKGLCFVGRVEEAYKMLTYLKTSVHNGGNVSPDIYSYTAVMDGLCKVGRSQEAIELLNEAMAMGLAPNVITYNALFNGYCKEGKPKKGLRLLNQMNDRGCVPDHISYSTLLHGLLKWGEISTAFRIYNRMVEAGFKVDERMMNTLLRAVCRKSWTDEGFLKNAYEVYYTMKSWAYAIYPDTYYLVIHTFCIGQEMDNALVSLNGMVGDGYFPRMVTINRIIHGLCKEGRIDAAFSVLVLLYEWCRVPSKICYNILIDELSRRGNLLGAYSVYGAALKLGVDPHRKPASCL